MPNRIIREAILTSDRVNQLTWAEEVFYRRLMSVVDDHGRFDGRPEILRARLYPLQLQTVSTPDTSSWIAACERAGLVRSYCVEGKPYIEILRFGQAIRSASKWPSPDGACAQVRADAPVSVSVGASPLTPQGGKRLRPRERAKREFQANAEELRHAERNARLAKWERDKAEAVPPPKRNAGDGSSPAA